MLNDTIVTLQGNLGSDVTLRRLGGRPGEGGENAVANFRVACTPRRLQRSTNEWVDGPTQWYSVSAWRQLGEHCERSLRRGDPVLVHGRLITSTYVNKAGVEVTAYDVEASVVGHDLNRGVSTFSRAVRSAPRQQESQHDQRGDQPDGQLDGQLDDQLHERRERPEEVAAPAA